MGEILVAETGMNACPVCSRVQPCPLLVEGTTNGTSVAISPTGILKWRVIMDEIRSKCVGFVLFG